MDRRVTTRFYTVDKKDEDGPDLSTCLERIGRLRLAERECELSEEISLRIEKINTDGRFIRGEIIRRQTQNLPARASAGRPRTRLGVDAIGHSSVFRYDRELSVLAIQLARNGITASRFVDYVSALIECPRFIPLPVISTEAWQLLQQKQVRALSLKVASPEQLSVADTGYETVKQGMENLRDIARSSYVDVTFGMSRGDANMSPRRFGGIIRWILREREAERGGIQKLSARIIPDDDESPILNLLNAHMGNSAVLELPDDNPVRSYHIRKNHIRAVFNQFLPAIQAQFG